MIRHPMTLLHTVEVYTLSYAPTHATDVPWDPVSPQNVTFDVSRLLNARLARKK
jgi:hypothetical protein